MRQLQLQWASQLGRQAGLAMGLVAFFAGPAIAQDDTSAAPQAATPEATPATTPEAAPAAATDAAATPAAETPAPAPQADSAQAAADHSAYGLLGPWRVGPTLQIGLPHPINYGLDVLYNKTWGLAFSTGKYTIDQIDPAEIQIANWDFRVRWHPWSGSFFLGAAYGEQVLFGSAKEDITLKTGGIETVVPTTVQIEATTTYLTPHLGWFAMWDSGFTLGFELGAQLPLSSKAELEVGFDNVTPSQEAAVKDSDEYKDLEKKVDDAGKMLGKTTLPYLTLLRLGWLF